jgi:hypothetical protein
MGRCLIKQRENSALQLLIYVSTNLTHQMELFKGRQMYQVFLEFLLIYDQADDKAGKFSTNLS